MCKILQQFEKNVSTCLLTISYLFLLKSSIIQRQPHYSACKKRHVLAFKSICSIVLNGAMSKYALNRHFVFMQWFLDNRIGISVADVNSILTFLSLLGYCYWHRKPKLSVGTLFQNHTVLPCLTIVSCLHSASTAIQLPATCWSPMTVFSRSQTSDSPRMSTATTTTGRRPKAGCLFGGWRLSHSTIKFLLRRQMCKQH